MDSGQLELGFYQPSPPQKGPQRPLLREGFKKTNDTNLFPSHLFVSVAICGRFQQTQCCGPLRDLWICTLNVSKKNFLQMVMSMVITASTNTAHQFDLWWWHFESWCILKVDESLHFSFKDVVNAIKSHSMLAHSQICFYFHGM